MIKKKILIFGKNSQLGKTFRKKIFFNKVKNFHMKYLTSSECDFKKKNDILSSINYYMPDIIINFASYNNVEKAEYDNSCYKINSNAVNIINNICIKKKIFFIHFSSDYVFNGLFNKAYKENDIKKPLNEYGKSKSNGEEFIIKSVNKNFLILRISWLYSKFNNNFPKKIIHSFKNKKKIKVIFNELGVPTSSKFVIKNLLKILFIHSKKKISGIYHLCPNGRTSRYDFAKLIVKKHHINGEIIKNLNNIKLKVRRPKSTILSSIKIQKKLNTYFLNWKDYYKSEML